LKPQTTVAPLPSITSVRAGLLQRKCACGGTPGRGSECEECGKKRLTLQRRAPSQAERTEVPPIVHEVLRSPGDPLDAAPRAVMEQRFGHDFSQVRVHTDARAVESVQAVNALAYTVGRHVVFGAGRYAPRTGEGQRLLAHELTHVVQQNRFSGLAREVSAPAASPDMGEREAERAAQRVLNGFPVTISQEGKGIQFYGQDSSCKDDEHLKPFIWPGHDHAKKAVDRAIGELSKSTFHPTVNSELRRLFGTDGIAKASTIKANFGTIRSALDEEYMYHCANPCVKPNKGARAWTDKSGNRDITICFDQVGGFSVPAAAWIIIHENVHRGLNVWPVPHPWDPKNFDDCVGATGGGLPTSDTSLLLTNPDSYACFASRMWFPL